MEADEGRKVKQLIRELRTESSSSKLDWIYSEQSAAAQSEEYLLGRRVDKAFESSKNGPVESRVGVADIPQPTLKVSASDESVSRQSDAKKLSEDPLFAIKQSEEAARLAWLNHPLRLKQLQKQKEEEEKKNKAAEDLDRKLAKKLAKLKKHSPEFIDELLTKKLKKLKGVNIRELLDETSSSSEFDSESGIDRRIAERLSSGKHSEREKRRRERSDETGERRDRDERENEKAQRKMDREYGGRRRDYSGSESEMSERRDRNGSGRTNRRTRDESDSERERVESSRRERGVREQRRRMDESDSERERGKKPVSGKGTRDEKRRRDKSESESEKDERSIKRRDERVRRVEERKAYRESSSERLRASISPERTSMKKIGGLDRLGKSPPRVRKEVYQEKKKEPEKVGRGGAKLKLTPEEMEKRRLEMERDAKNREKERAERVAKYREEAEKEEVDHKDKDPDFLKRELAKAASVGTVEGRIKANVANIQRGKVAMEKNFARR